jgi:HEAT repeat protein
MLKGAFVTVILSGVLIGLGTNLRTSSMAQHDKTEQVRFGLQKLYSGDDPERHRARSEILALREASIEPLCFLLSDLLTNPYPRFPTGSEDEAAKALAIYSTMTPENSSPEEWDNRTEVARRFFINSRLIQDVVLLLGELKAEQAAPLLVKIMESRNLWSGPDGFGGEMIALCRIGESAIPYLVTAIREARTTARRQEDVNLSFVVDDQLNARAEEGTEPARITTSEELEEEQEEIEVRLHKIQIRAVMVLGEIGDRRVLPFLENLKIETRDESLIHDICAAIRAIETRRAENPPHAGSMVLRERPW